MNEVSTAALSPRFVDAVAYAVEVHAAQRRKGTAVPYAAHLLGVSSLVLEAGGDEDLAIAGLLHDAAEDHGGEERLADISARFGPRVAGIVRECSDSLSGEEGPKRDWESRKREHLALLAGASDDALLVWAADKVHNGRAIIADVATQGDSAFARFNAAPDRILWYYRENLVLLESRNVPTVLVVSLRAIVARLAELIGLSSR